MNAILAFWIAYILTRPLGASIGDYLSQSVEETGLGLWTILTSVIFLTTILALVVYLTVTKRDLIAVSSAEAQLDGHETEGEPRVLVVTSETDATPAVIEAVRESALAGPEIILETLPSHVSHWLHVDLP